jgi:hypothetical protein
MKSNVYNLSAYIVCALLACQTGQSLHGQDSTKPTLAEASPSVNPADELEKAVIRGDWKALTENASDDSVAHFVKAAANGVLGNYRIMAEEFRKSKGGEVAIEQFWARKKGSCY